MPFWAQPDRRPSRCSRSTIPLFCWTAAFFSCCRLLAPQEFLNFVVSTYRENHWECFKHLIISIKYSHNIHKSVIFAPNTHPPDDFNGSQWSWIDLNGRWTKSQLTINYNYMFVFSVALWNCCAAGLIKPMICVLQVLKFDIGAFRGRVSVWFFVDSFFFVVGFGFLFVWLVWCSMRSLVFVLICSSVESFIWGRWTLLYMCFWVSVLGVVYVLC